MQILTNALHRTTQHEEFRSRDTPNSVHLLQHTQTMHACMHVQHIPVCIHLSIYACEGKDGLPAIVLFHDGQAPLHLIGTMHSALHAL